MATTLQLLNLMLSILLMLNSISILSFSCSLDQKQALLHFKHTLTTLFNSSSSQFDELDSWNPNSDCCTWDRVTCDTTTNVTELHLDSVVPHQLFNLVRVFSDILTPLFHIRSLKTLDISGNSLVGQIPGDGFGNLTRLVQLRMSSNNFNGSIPRQIFKLKYLQVLGLSNNVLKGDLSQEVGNLTKLVELRMGLNRFTGRIPHQLFELRSLRILDLSYNILEGVLSHEVGKLRNLECLYLDDNVLSGNIPEEIGNLTKLKVFYLQNNRFSGGIPSSIINMKELETLYLANNSLSMQIPAEIGRLPNMTTLDLSKNQLIGPIPSSISNLTKLVTLWLHHNKLAGDIPTCLFNITTLQYLFIGGKGSNLTWNNKAKIVPRCDLTRITMTNCGISGQIPEWISSQRHLDVLDLSMNQLEGRFPNWLGEMNISSIVLSDNKLTGSIPSCLFESPLLQTLALARNNFSGELPNNIGNARGMMMLLLPENNFSGKIPMSMFNMSNLQVLDLSRNIFSGDRFPDFRESTLPSYFDFSFNYFFGKIPTSFSANTRILSFSGNRFSGDLPLNLTNLVSLESLDLHGNDITGNFQDVLPQIPTLQVLNLRKNSIVGFIPRTISNLSSLRILDLSGNNLTGTIPLEIANLERLIQTPNTKYNPFDVFLHEFYIDADLCDNAEFEDLIVNWKNSFQGLSSHTLSLYSFLDLSDNKLSGEIPSLLGNLKGLKVLNISHNNISGHIPVSFGNLTHIESLDLSHNRISGSIPQSLANLNEITTFDVSNNRLTGKIPMGRQMNTMNDLKFYANNSGLCGMQINITCPEDIPPTEGTDDEEEDSKEEGKILSLVFWEGTWVGFPVGLFSSILIMGYFQNILQLFKFW